MAKSVGAFHGRDALSYILFTYNWLIDFYCSDINKLKQRKSDWKGHPFSWNSTHIFDFRLLLKVLLEDKRYGRLYSTASLDSTSSCCFFLLWKYLHTELAVIVLAPDQSINPSVMATSCCSNLLLSVLAVSDCVVSFANPTSTTSCCNFSSLSSSHSWTSCAKQTTTLLPILSSRRKVLIHPYFRLDCYYILLSICAFEISFFVLCWITIC